MLRVVTTNNSDIFRHFGSRVFQALGVEHSVATDYERAAELVRTKRPDVAILDAEIPGGDGYELCRLIKADPQLANVRVMLVLPSIVSREQLEKIEQCGCDDVLAPPLHTDDLHFHMSQVAGVPFRRFVRQTTRLDARLGDGTRAVVEDLSLGGAGMLVSGAVARGDTVAIELERDGQAYPPITAVVAWTVAEGNATRIGAQFSELPIEARILIEQLCLFDARTGEDGALTIGLHGDFNETTDFAPLAARLRHADSIDFDMREVRYLSSMGVRAWCQFLDQIRDKSYTFRQASIAFVSQVAMMPAAVGTGTIRSFEAPYRCDSCDRDDVRLLETRAIAHEVGEPLPPTLHCPTCNDELMFDDIPQRYLAFCSAG